MSAQAKLGCDGGHLLFDGGRVGILLLHGPGGTSIEWKFLAQALNRAGHTVYCPLLVGGGGSGGRLNATTWMDWYRSVAQAHDALKERSEVVIVGGFCAGAMLALHLAAERPQQVDATLLYSPTFWPDGWGTPRYLGLLKRLPYKWLADLISLQERAPYGTKDERIREVVLNSLQSEGHPIRDFLGRKGRTVLEFHGLAKTVDKQLGSIKQPTLIFRARFDDQSDIRNSVLLQSKLGGLTELVVLDDSYHMVTLDRQRTDVADRSVDFCAWVIRRREQQREILRLKQAAERSSAAL